MKNKLYLGVLGALFVGVLATVSVSGVADTSIAKGETSHVGNHIAENAKFGVKEYYVCCSCHDHWLAGEQPEGKWTDTTLSDSEYEAVAALRDDRYIWNPELILSSQDYFYHYIHFKTWGDGCVPGEKMVAIGDQLTIWATDQGNNNLLFTDAQIKGANYIRFTLNFVNNNEEGPAVKKIMGYHGGGALDHSSTAKVDDNGNAVLTVNLKSYLYDIDGQCKLALNLYGSSNENCIIDNTETFKSSNDCIPEMKMTVTSVEIISEYNIEKGNTTSFDVTYDYNGIMTGLDFTDHFCNIGDWNNEMIKIKQNYYADMYKKGYRYLVVGGSYDKPNEGTLGFYNWSSTITGDISEQYPGNYTGTIFKLAEGGIDLGFGTIKHGDNSNHRDDNVHFELTWCKTSSEADAAAELAEKIKGDGWKYFHHGKAAKGTGVNVYYLNQEGNFTVTGKLLNLVRQANYSAFMIKVKASNPASGTISKIQASLNSANISDPLIYEGDTAFITFVTNRWGNNVISDESFCAQIFAKDSNDNNLTVDFEISIVGYYSNCVALTGASIKYLTNTDFYGNDVYFRFKYLSGSNNRSPIYGNSESHILNAVYLNSEACISLANVKGYGVGWYEIKLGNTTFKEDGEVWLAVDSTADATVVFSLDSALE